MPSEPAQLAMSSSLPSPPKWLSGLPPAPRMRPSKGKEGTLLVAPLLAKVVHGGAVPLVWVIGIVLIVAGVVSLIRGSLLMGVVLIVIGIFLGGLNVL